MRGAGVALPPGANREYVRARLPDAHDYTAPKYSTLCPTDK